MKQVVDWLTNNATGFFDAIAAVLDFVIGLILAVLETPPALVVVAAIAALAWWLRRSVALTVFVVLALLFIINQGYWEETTKTLALVLASATVCMVIGVPLGIAAARRPWLMSAMRPVLDLMQTIPTFVYLIPALILFGLGMVPGLIATVIFALPASIRLTHLGVSTTPTALVEAAESFGATPWQRLVKVEIPWALPQILAGLTQTIMLSLSMVVIAALVGADGLGVPVVRALNSVNVGMGFTAGLAIVLLAIILDRLCRADDRGARR
jgi:glycine betaine/proline transport system permease protein